MSKKSPKQIKTETVTAQQAIMTLWKLLLHMLAWGTDSYGELDEQDRGDFAELLEKRRLFEAVENVKRLALRAGAQLSDKLLNVKVAAHLERGGQLLEADRSRLNEALDELCAMICQHDALTTEQFGCCVAASDPRPMLGKRAALVYELLLKQPEYVGLTAPEVVTRIYEQSNHMINLDESTLRKSIIPALKPYGVEHVAKVGYRISPNRRPKP
jgi:hypothetical protein